MQIMKKLMEDPLRVMYKDAQYTYGLARFLIAGKTLRTILVNSKTWGTAGSKVRRGVMVKRADSQHTGFQFESCTRHNKNANGEEGNGEPPHEVHFPRRNSKHCLWFLPHSKSSM